MEHPPLGSPLDGEAMGAPERDRVRGHTARRVLDRTDDRTDRAARAAVAAGPEGVRARLARIDREWDVDRALMANFAVLGGLSFAATVASGRRWSGWHTLLSAQLAFLLVHATVGWCPPLPVFRRLGFRTAKEIGRERRVLLGELVSETPVPGA